VVIVEIGRVAKGGKGRADPVVVVEVVVVVEIGRVAKGGKGRADPVVVVEVVVVVDMLELKVAVVAV
jgi:hypothetical protein